MLEDKLGLGVNQKEVWEVEKIIEKKIDPDGKTLWLVKWKGYSMKESTWEPRESFYYDPDEFIPREKKLSNSKRTETSDTSTLKEKTKKKKQAFQSIPESEKKDLSENEKPERLNTLNWTKPLAVDPIQLQTNTTESVTRSKESEEPKTNADFNNELALESPLGHQLEHKLQNSSELITPTYLDTGRALKNTESSILKDSIEHFGICYSDPSYSAFKSKLNLLNDEDDIFRNSTSDHDGLLPQLDFQFQIPTQEYSYTRETTNPVNIVNLESFYRSNQLKRVCKGADNDTYSFKISRLDMEKHLIEIACFENIKNQHLYTQWLDIEQASKICPIEIISVFFNMITPQDLR